MIVGQSAAISNKLKDNVFYVDLRWVRFSYFVQYEVVAQGNVLSMTLFLVTINSLSKHLPKSVRCSLLVDYFVIWIVVSSAE